MSIAERYKYIQEQLNKHGYIRVADIANELNVTKATIRKDLRFLESQKVLYRTHGRATAANPHVMDISVQVKSHINTELKRIIAREAAKLIADNDSIIVASGSTLYAFAEQIATDSHLNVVTPDLRVAVLLNENEKIDVIQLGGKIYKNTLSVRGEMAATELKDIRCSKVFFGSDGIDDETGITCSTLEEARLTNDMMEAASQTVLLVDSTKFGRRGFAKICPLDRIDIIVTDDGISEQAREYIEEAGVDLIIAKTNGCLIG